MDNQLVFQSLLPLDIQIICRFARQIEIGIAEPHYPLDLSIRRIEIRLLQIRTGSKI